MTEYELLSLQAQRAGNVLYLPILSLLISLETS
jgi:hypothetical protein